MPNRNWLGLAIALSVMFARAVGAQEQWRLVEDRRIGGDASEMTIFTSIRSIVVGPNGNIFVLDARPQQIRVFDASGRFDTLAARRGQGPGEILNANGMLLIRDTIWVNDPGNGRWVALSPADGRYLRQVAVPMRGFGFVWEAGVDADGRIVEPLSVPTGRVDPIRGPESQRRSRVIRMDGGVVDTIAATSCEQRVPAPKTIFIGRQQAGSPVGINIGIPFLAEQQSVFDGRGGYWCTPNDEYLLVHRSAATGDTLHAVRKPYTRVPVTADERRIAIDRTRTSLARYPIVDADYSLIPRLKPVFVRLDIDDRAQLWARRVTPAGEPAAFDVYDASGRAVAVVTTPLAFSANIPLHIRGEHAYGVVRDADDVPYIVRARIVKGRP